MINIPAKQWIHRLAPGVGEGINNDLKHGRFVECPDDGLIYNFGGDWTDTTGATTGQQEVYRYDIEADDGLGNGVGWTKIQPYCAAPGFFKPAGSDQITAVWDSNRHIFWNLPGFMPGLPGANVDASKTIAIALAQNGLENTISSADPLNDYVDNGHSNKAIMFINDDLTVEYVLYDGIDVSITPHRFLNVQRGFGGTPKGAHAIGERFYLAGTSPCSPRTTVRGQFPSTCFSFDPATFQFTIRSKMGAIPSGEGSANGFYDPVSDQIIRITGSSTVSVRRFSLPNPAIFTLETFSGFGLNSIPIGNNDIAWDEDHREAYVIQPGNPSTMLKYHVDNHTMVKITGTGQTTMFTNPVSSAGVNCYYPKYDTINDVLLWPFVSSFSSGSALHMPNQTVDLQVYHPRAGFGHAANTWETVPINPSNARPEGNTWVFSKAQNCLLGMGRSENNFMSLFRYASTSPAHRPTGLAAFVR